MPAASSGRCSELVRHSLSASHFESATKRKARLDHRSSSSLELIGYAAGGALPSQDAWPHSRKTPHGVGSRATLPSAPPASAEPLMRCTICRLVAHELELAQELVQRCGAPSSLLARTPESVCDHMRARGYLGHTEKRVSYAYTICTDIIDDRSEALQAALNDKTKSSPSPGRLHPIACAEEPRSSCPLGADEPVPGWPAALQILLDQDDEPLARGLQPPKGAIITALARDVSGEKGAVSALLLLAAARSDVLVIKMLCVLGVCEKALRTAPSPFSLADVLANATVSAAKSSATTSVPSRDELIGRARRQLQFHWDAARGQASCSAGGASENPEHELLRGWLSPVHLSAFLLDAEALAVMLRRSPDEAGAFDRNGRQPLHYLAHGSERFRLAVYLFHEQPFRTWLQQHTASRLHFAPPLTRGNLTRELEPVQLATAALLVHHRASPTAVDGLGQSPIHVASASGASAKLLKLLGRAAAAEASGGASGRKLSEADAMAALTASLAARDASGRDGAALAAAGGHVLPKEVLAMTQSDDNPATADVGASSGLVTPECSIDVVSASAISPAEMHERYVLRGRPVALTAATAVAPKSDLLSAASFRKAFGKRRWVPQLLLPGNSTALASYLDATAAGKKHRPLSFNRPEDPQTLRALRESVRWPTALSFSSPHRRGGYAGGGEVGGDGGGGVGGSAGLDFFIGGNGSGTPAHHHSAVWNALTFGRKLWALQPPASATFGPAGEHPLDSSWWREWQARQQDAAPSPSPSPSSHLFCVQAAGTLLYIPEGWGHATLNLDEGLSVGGFLQDEGGLGLHMQLLHAPRGIGSLQNAATWADDWFALTQRAFPGLT